MKIIGFSSGTVVRFGNEDRMVKAIIDKSGHENEFVKLTDLVYSGCKGCSWLCAKPFVGVICGYRTIDAKKEKLRYRLRRENLLDVVEYISCTPPCVRCGRHQECSIGGLYQMLGEAAHSKTITAEMFHRWEDDLSTVATVDLAASKLRYL